MASDLPKEFDVVVLGTGMPESIVAAAFSRIGQTVLHLDRNEYYSGDWASFNLQGVEKWVQQHQATDDIVLDDKICRPDIDEASLLGEGESLVQMPLHNTNFSQVDMQFFVGEDDEVTKLDDVQEQSGLDEIELKGMKDLNIPCDIIKQTDAPIDNQQGSQIEPVPNQTENQSVDIPREDSATEVKDANVDDVTQCSGELLGADKVNEQSAADDMYKDKDKTDNNKSAGSSTTDSSAETENVKQDIAYIKSEAENAKDKKWTVKKLKSEWRKFNLDLSPKVLYSGGDMVELLISSDIAKYCEFKTVTRVLTQLNGSLERVPCSRADVFSSKKVSMLEKRMLMKFLQFCVEYENKPEDVKDFLDKPFVEFLTSRKLTTNVKHYIQHSIAMATDSMTTEEGLLQMKLFLKSLGRYGNTAFLWSLYGSGELPQSFCRMCAVFGGIYCLRMSASSLVMDVAENKCKGIITTEGQKIQCKWLIMESGYAPDRFISLDNKIMISRAIIMTETPLSPTDQQELSLMCLPCPDDGDRPVFVLELPPSSMASPRNVYIYHLTRKGNRDVTPKEDLFYAIDTLFKTEASSDDERPVIMWSLYFSQCDKSHIQPSDQLPSNVFLMSGPGTEIDIDRPVQEAKDVFKRILPDEEFLPKAPNPEDIIYVDDSEAQVTEGNSKSEFKDSETDQSEMVKNDKDFIKTESETECQAVPQEIDNQSEVQETAGGATEHANNKTTRIVENELAETVN